MIYATGRDLNYVEERKGAAIVAKNLPRDEGFRDLILDLVASETFRTK